MGSVTLEGNLEAKKGKRVPLGYEVAENPMEVSVKIRLLPQEAGAVESSNANQPSLLGWPLLLQRLLHLLLGHLQQTLDIGMLEDRVAMIRSRIKRRVGVGPSRALKRLPKHAP